MKLKNVFSWSKTGQETFAECKRKYYYDKYGFWGAWDADASEDTKYIDLLKNLKPVEMWTGEVVHDTIRQILVRTRAKMTVTPDAIVESMINHMKAEIRSSETGLYKVQRKSCALLPHEYHLLFDDKTMALAFDRAARCILNFCSSTLYAQIKAIPPSWFKFIDDDKPQSFQFEGTSINLKIDFARQDPDGITIYDWKTGNRNTEDNERLQIGVYTLYVMDIFKLPLANVKMSLFYLNESHEPEEKMVTEADLDYCREVMRKGISEMKSLLDDPLNNLANIEKYPRNESRCLVGNQICKYKKLCFPVGDSVFTSTFLEE